jgi:hypothetical protein
MTPAETPIVAWSDLLRQLSPDTIAWLQTHAGRTIYYYRHDIGWVRTELPTDPQP